jgi:hypothetical protein
LKKAYLLDNNQQLIEYDSLGAALNELFGEYTSYGNGITSLMDNRDFAITISTRTEVNWIVENETSFYTVGGIEKKGKVFDKVTEITNEISGNINESVFINEINIWPNPSDGIYHFLLPIQKGVTAYIYSITGEFIKTEFCNSEQCSFDLSTFPSGVYFFRTQDGNFTKKLIKK